MTLRALKSLAAIAVVLAAAAPLSARALVPAGNPAPSFSAAKDAEGGSFSPADFDGAHTLVVFFSAYIDGAAETLKGLDSLRKQAPIAGKLDMVAVNMDPSREAAAAFMKEKDIRVRLIIDNNLELANKFGVRKPPAAFIIGPDRAVKFSSDAPGASGRFGLEKKLASILSGGGGSNAASLENEFKEKKLVASGASLIKVCPSDGNLLLYVSNDGILWSYNIETGTRKNLAADAVAADWAPGCDAVVYGRKKKGDLWLKRLEEPAEMISQSGRAPAWSPSGDMIAYLDGDSVWIYNLPDEKKWQTTAVGTGAQWARGGALILVTDAKGRAWLVSPLSRASLIQRIFR
jgi:peroxiredoxin